MSADYEQDNQYRRQADCKPLLELATPYIYRHNLFRVLGLPVNVTSKDAQRQQKRLEMQKKLGIASSEQSGRILALDPPPTEEDVRAAMERLHRPIDRFLDEIFWFWPISGDVRNDPAFKALEQQDITHAMDIWIELAKVSGERHIAMHNLAVLDHVNALDYEARFTISGLGDKEREHLLDLWGSGLARWKEVIDGEDFWDALKRRVRELNDVQLTTGFVYRVRSTLPTALLLFNAKLAYGASERGENVLAQRHVKLLREAGFGDRLADEAIREAIRPLRNRVKAATDNAKDKWKNKPYHGSQYVRELHGQAVDLLTIVDTILPADDPTREALHDMVAEAMLEGQVAFGKKTNDWRECIELLNLAQKLAQGNAVQSKLSENMEILRKNAELGNNWYSLGYWDLPEEIVESLEAIHEKANSGNYDGAINSLVILDPKLGKPLRRCLAYCLSMHGIRVANEALSENGAETEVIRKIMDRLIKAGDNLRLLQLLHRPTPHSEPPLPPCLCCGSSSYTRWVDFTYRDISLFMCNACNEKHKRELASREYTLRGHISTALEYLLLADELDPGDVGVKKNLKTLKETARGFNCSIPKTNALKNRLENRIGAQKIQSIRHVFEPTPEDHTCFFCADNSANDTCQITVPMCGDVQVFDLLFNSNYLGCVDIW
uniref:Uncharacterized protein n=1 Tax=Candidatus Kentrum sp. FM TaxID=2126340 RepID=A0A450SDQ6_9GAMM|nr:MAG: hypothetical protein BECKFM1743C_GA0114222_100882 [Candidatus Kentron sp. FM]VFJ50720.1 MAG: hypothetical protein BECKFM1743A_GA0114220_100872 [Candidatus Kentron sp. FM]VFK08736.1 MAG: hypothetical protein BECKFM1743B_GA0114221_100802 [Candidatus Kentron sp. FM]